MQAFFNPIWWNFLTGRKKIENFGILREIFQTCECLTQWWTRAANDYPSHARNFGARSIATAYHVNPCFYQTFYLSYPHIACAKRCVCERLAKVQRWPSQTGKESVTNCLLMERLCFIWGWLRSALYPMERGQREHESHDWRNAYTLCIPALFENSYCVEMEQTIQA